MTVRTILKGYGFWLLGVLSAVGAFYFLWRSRAITWDLELEQEGGGDGHFGVAERVDGYTGPGDAADVLRD